MTSVRCNPRVRFIRSSRTSISARSVGFSTPSGSRVSPRWPSTFNAYPSKDPARLDRTQPRLVCPVPPRNVRTRRALLQVARRGRRRWTHRGRRRSVDSRSTAPRVGSLSAALYKAPRAVQLVSHARPASTRKSVYARDRRRYINLVNSVPTPSCSSALGSGTATAVMALMSAA